MAPAVAQPHPVGPTRRRHVTNRYLPARNAFLRPLFRLALPIAFFGSTIAAAGCLQQIGAPGEPSVPVKQKLPVVLSAPNVAPREDSPPSIPRLSGTPSPETKAVQVMPDGAVVPADSDSVVNAPVVHWLTTTVPTTLWSSSGEDAAAFTDAPAGSFMRVAGPQENGRE